jgi:hypothetical protein
MTPPSKKKRIVAAADRMVQPVALDRVFTAVDVG